MLTWDDYEENDVPAPVVARAVSQGVSQAAHTLWHNRNGSNGPRSCRIRSR
jgi:hypothetical protein